MRTITPTDMRQRLGEILDAASAGERILIERDRQPLAVLVSVEDAQRLDGDAEERARRRLAALDRLAAFRDRMLTDWPRPPGTPTGTEMVRMDRDGADAEGPA
jgi:prevent-host-death family protein